MSRGGDKGLATLLSALFGGSVGGPAGALAGAAFGALLEDSQPQRHSRFRRPIRAIGPFRISCPSCRREFQTSRSGSLKCPHCRSRLHTRHCPSCGDYVYSGWAGHFTCRRCTHPLDLGWPVDICCPSCRHPTTIPASGEQTCSHCQTLIWSRKCRSCRATLATSFPTAAICGDCGTQMQIGPPTHRKRAQSRSRFRHDERAQSPHDERKRYNWDHPNGRGARTLEEAYRTLGAKPTWSDEDIKKRKRQLMSEYHPDRIAGRSLSPEIVRLVEEKFKVINDAHEVIMEHRRKRGPKCW